MSLEVQDDSSATELAHEFVATTHLLVVDDEPYVRNLLNRYLAKEHRTVDLAADGKEAWDKLRRFPYDCILLDMRMPVIMGTDLYRMLAGYDEEMAKKVIFITGDTGSAETRDFISTVKNPVFTKPLDLPKIEEAIKKMLRVGTAP